MRAFQRRAPLCLFCIIGLVSLSILLNIWFKRNSKLEINDNQIVKLDSWQVVETDHLFVFSAYVEHRQPWYPAIRVIGLRRTFSYNHHSAVIFYSNNSNVKIPCTSHAIEEHWNLKFSACFIICKLTSEYVPVKISFETSSSEGLKNVLTVHNNIYHILSKQSFAVCVKPLHHDYNDYVAFIEFMEIHQLLGVSHFVFYNHSVGKEVEQAIQMYLNESLITILPWQLNINLYKIRTEGIFAALNDCLYRLMHHYKYLVMVDLDEVIIPRIAMTYPELIHMEETLYNFTKLGGFIVMNAFFYKEWKDDFTLTLEVKDHQIPYLATLLKTQRVEKPHVWKIRSKYIVVPKAIEEVGNHFIWKSIPSYRTLSIPESHALLHHYRSCDYEGCLHQNSIIDKETHKYKDNLVKRVNYRLKLMEKMML